jgi:hypothetical protein
MELCSRTITVYWMLTICLLVLIEPVTCRFYRNIPLPREPQRVVQIDTAMESAPIPMAQVEIYEDDEGNLRPLERAMDKEQLGSGSHLMLLRPDYTFRKVASLFRNFFDKRMGTVSERKRRNG